MGALSSHLYEQTPDWVHSATSLMTSRGGLESEITELKCGRLAARGAPRGRVTHRLAGGVTVPVLAWRLHAARLSRRNQGLPRPLPAAYGRTAQGILFHLGFIWGTDHRCPPP